MGNLYHYLFLLLLPALSQSINLPSEIKLVTWNVLNDSDLIDILPHLSLTDCR